MRYARLRRELACFLLGTLNACGGTDMFGASGFGFGGTAGATRVGPPPAAGPAVAISSPSGGATLDVATTVTISGTCDSGTTSMRVKYGGTIVSTAASPVAITGTTWSFKWSPGTVRVGTQNLTAEGEKPGSATGTSAAVSVTVSGVPARAKCNTFLHADDLGYADGVQVATWTARVGTSGTGNAGATMEADGWPAGAYGTKKSVRLTSASSGRIDVDGLSSLFTGSNQPMYVVVIGQTIDTTGSRTFFSAGSSTSSTHKWLLWQSAAAPTSLKLLKGAVTTTFDNNSQMRGDTGKHAYAALDAGTQVQAYRDWEARMGECTISGAAGGGANSGGASNLIDRATIGSYCSAGTYGNFWDGRIRAVWVGTSAPTAAELDNILNFVVGNYDKDQYYGDATRPWNLEIYAGQSNAAGTAPSTGEDAAVPGIRFWARSINNWINDPVTHVDLAPQGTNVGAWYYGAVKRKALSGGADLHALCFAKGTTGINSFNTEDDIDYYSTQLYDEFCRQYQAFICQMGGAPTARLYWNQGESDAQSLAAANAYLGVLVTLAAKWRARISPTLPIVFTEMNTNMAAGTIYNSVVNDGIRTFVRQTTNAVSFPTADMSAALYLQGDVLRYNRAGQIELGHRNATASFVRLGQIAKLAPPNMKGAPRSRRAM